MDKPFLESHPNTSVRTRASVPRIIGLVTCIVCSVVLPFYLLDEFHCLSFPEQSGNSVFTNAVRFYIGDGKAAHNPERYIAIVTYFGLSGDSDMEATKSSVDEIIQDQVMPEFERKGLRFKLETNENTDVRLYYKKDYTDVGRSDVKVFCLVTSRAAFALVVV